jgi:pimeloyl-ACP methyl ester carboxylesterase
MPGLLLFAEPDYQMPTSATVHLQDVPVRIEEPAMPSPNSYVLSCLAAAATALAGTALAGGEAGKLELRDLGGKFVGYTTKSVDNGSVDVLNPMFVQYLLPARRRHDYPIVFIHGGGGQGTDWLETPDGRDGFVDYFVADGWDVYVVDRPGHGRAQSNSSCGNGQMRVGNSAIIARLSTSSPNVWPGGEPTPTNDAVVGWTASSAPAPYCGDALAAQTISALLDEIGPAVLLAHSAGGGSTFRVPDLNSEKVVGIIGFEAAGSNPAAGGFNNSPALLTSWKTEPALPASFTAVDRNGCAMQGDNPSRLVNYAGLPVVLVATEMGTLNKAQIECAAAVWDQAGAEASAVYLPDQGLKGGGHFAMAQLDNAAYAREFMKLAADIEAAAKR